MRLRTRTGADWLALAAGLLGVAVLCGYATHSAALVGPWQNSAMVINTAISLVLAALALTLRRRGRTVFTQLLLALNAAVLVENTAGLSLGVDFPRQFAWLHEPSVHAGRMAPVTNYGFLMLGVALLLLPRVQTRGGGAAVRWLTWGVMAAGVVGVLGTILRLDLLYSFRELSHMSLDSGAGLLVLGLALWLDWRHRRWNRSPEGEQAGRILSAATVALVVALVAAGFSGLLVVQRLAERDAATNLELRRQERVSYVGQLLHEAMARGRAYAAQPALAARLSGGQGGKLPFPPPQDFSSVALEWAGSVVAHAGGPLRRAVAAVAVPEGAALQLLWDGEFYLQQTLPVMAGTRSLGTVIMQQPLPLLGSIGVESAAFGSSGEIGLCGQVQGSTQLMECFPQRMRPRPRRLRVGKGGPERPMALALSGKTGIADTIDYRGERVLAAYAPVPGMGLGLVVKMDSRELYASIRRQITILVPLLAFLAFAGLELLRWQVRPLVQQLVASRNQALSSEARFRAAAESGMDPFYIFESMRDPATGAISGFQLVYANHPGEVFAGLEPGKVARPPLSDAGTQGVSEVPRSESMRLGAVPQLAAATALQEKLKHVVADRRGWVEEFDQPNPDASAPGAQWLHLQAVPLGDGVAVTVRDISERKWEQEQLRVTAQTDALTGLANRGTFQNRLAHAMETSRRLWQQALLAVLYLDIDHFKEINDTLGHAAGDEILRGFGAVLLRSVRSSDLVARLGGDEFAILLENLESAADAERVMAAIFKGLEEPMRLEPHLAEDWRRPERSPASVGPPAAGLPTRVHPGVATGGQLRKETAVPRLTITTSIGMTYYRGEEAGSEQLLQQADSALYAAKRGGRNTWRTFAG
ncbi:MAG: diguanylate cyclase domain-containing protein [Terriglobales bacterium]